MHLSAIITVADAINKNPEWKDGVRKMFSSENPEETTQNPPGLGSTANYDVNIPGADVTPPNVLSAENFQGDDADFDYPAFDAGPTLNQFFGKIEKKPKGSVLMLFDGQSGGGKTYTSFYAINEFLGTGNRVLFASVEEEPQSAIFRKKVNQFINPTNMDRFFAFGESYLDNYDNPFQHFLELCQNYDVIFIDSWNVLLDEYGKQFDMRTLRKQVDSKLFIPIIHRNRDGSLKGGSRIKQNSDISWRVKAFTDYNLNYSYFGKNRYTTVPANSLYFHNTQHRLLSADEVKEINQKGVPLTEKAES